MSDICKTTYEEIKKDKKFRYVVFFIKDEKQIDVETVGKSTSHRLTTKYILLVY